MIDSVVTCYGSPATSGVAKFNVDLARRLVVPCLRLVESGRWNSPLVSLKPSEMRGDPRWSGWYPSGYSLFLHDWSETDRRLPAWVMGAQQVYAANRAMATQIRPLRADVVEAWCPSTIRGQASRGSIDVLTFGMAHKLREQVGRYRRLKDLLDGSTQDYTVSLSTAVHEGSPWDEVSEAGDVLREVFGSRLRSLGYLLDDGIAAEFARCTAVALFYEPALRENHTTFWAAVEAGKLIITNTDDASPTKRLMEVTAPVGPSAVYNLADMAAWPGPPFHKWAVGNPTYSWDALIERFSVGVLRV